MTICMVLNTNIKMNTKSFLLEYHKVKLEIRSSFYSIPMKFCEFYLCFYSYTISLVFLIKFRKIINLQLLIKYFILLIFYIFSNYFLFFSIFCMHLLDLVESLQKTNKKYLKIDRFRSNLTLNKNDMSYNRQLLKNLPGHHCLFKIEKKENNFFLQATTLHR